MWRYRCARGFARHSKSRSRGPARGPSAAGRGRESGTSAPDVGASATNLASWHAESESGDAQRRGALSRSTSLARCESLRGRLRPRFGVSRSSPLVTIVRELDRAGIPHMLAGSFASSYHGDPRTTNDIDLVIAPTRASYAPANTRARGHPLPEDRDLGAPNTPAPVTASAPPWRRRGWPRSFGGSPR
jgi:hypothetical protein